MQFSTLLVFALLVGAVVCDKKKSKKTSREEEEESGEQVTEQQLRHHHESFQHRRYDASKMVDYFVRNPVTKRQRECFETKFHAGDSIDFVIDLAPSPSLDHVDKACANSPVGLYLESWKAYPSVTRSYFDFITLFIDIVSYSMKPQLTHTVIYDHVAKTRFYLRGRYINETVDAKQYGRDFSDAVRNLKTMWPVSTKSLPEGMESKMANILVNNLGRMTKLALWNRDNGLPCVLSGSRRSKPVYSIVLSDGASGASIDDLVDDITRTTVIDIGNHRFADRLTWDQIRLMPSLFTLTAPQSLPAFAGTVRNMACLLATNYRESSSQSAGKAE